MITITPNQEGAIKVHAGQPITLRIKDSGQAGVSLRLSYGTHKLRFDEVHMFDNSVQFPGLPPGEYILLASIHVQQSVYGSTWNSSWYINKQLIAESHGDLGEAPSDDGFYRFQLSAT